MSVLRVHFGIEDEAIDQPTSKCSPTRCCAIMFPQFRTSRLQATTIHRASSGDVNRIAKILELPGRPRVSVCTSTMTKCPPRGGDGAQRDKARCCKVGSGLNGSSAA
jgi:hypothetical protein